MHRNVYHACRSISFHEDYGFLNITDGIHVPCVHCTLPCIRKWYVHRSLTHRREWKIDETRHEREPILRYSFFFFFPQANFDEPRIWQTLSFVLYLFRSTILRVKLFDETRNVHLSSNGSVKIRCITFWTRLKFVYENSMELRLPWLMVPISFILLDELKNFFTRSFAITINVGEHYQQDETSKLIRAMTRYSSEIYWEKWFGARSSISWPTWLNFLSFLFLQISMGTVSSHFTIRIGSSIPEES